MVRRLLAKANQEGGEDNVTVVVAKRALKFYKGTQVCVQRSNGAIEEDWTGSAKRNLSGGVKEV